MSRAVHGGQAVRAVALLHHTRLGEALLHMTDPPIRALFVAANNPAVTCPDAGAVRRGLAREDLFTVVHDPFLSDTARHADLVLPAALYLETEDVLRAYGTYYLQFLTQVLPPPGEAWSDGAYVRGAAGAAAAGAGCRQVPSPFRQVPPAVRCRALDTPRTARARHGWPPRWEIVPLAWADLLPCGVPR